MGSGVRVILGRRLESCGWGRASFETADPGGRGQTPRILKVSFVKIEEARGTSFPFTEGRLKKLEALEITKAFLIDDEPSVLRALERGIKRGLDIPTITASPAQGRNIIEEIISSGAELVITDFNMPYMSGDQIIKGLRQHKYQGLIIGLTGRPENALPFYQAETDLVLVKPYEIKDITNLFS